MKHRLFIAPILMLLLLSTVDGSLDVKLALGHPEIYPSQSQTLIITSNEGGIGVLLVVQPAEGTPWMDFLGDHSTLEGLWNMLSNHTRTEVAEKLGQKVVSFSLLGMGEDGGNVTLTFPEDFTGINGDPNTEIAGDYKALLVFLSCQQSSAENECCYLLEVDFDCVSWPVIPELASGLMILVLFTAITLVILKTRRSPGPRNGMRSNCG